MTTQKLERIARFAMAECRDDAASMYITELIGEIVQPEKHVSDQEDLISRMCIDGGYETGKEVERGEILRLLQVITTDAYNHSMSAEWIVSQLRREIANRGERREPLLPDKALERIRELEEVMKAFAETGRRMTGHTYYLSGTDYWGLKAEDFARAKEVMEKKI